MHYSCFQFDRFLAQHIAVVYYWLTCAIYIASPRMAYNLMEQARTPETGVEPDSRSLSAAASSTQGASK